MSRVEGASEASMEDILASIRKIIADDPAPPASAEAPPGKPAETPKGIPLPAGRDALSGGDTAKGAPGSSGQTFFRTPPAAASAPAPVSEPPVSRSLAAAIDDDLAGLIETPSSTSPSAEKAPPLTAKPHGTASSVEAAREKWANLINPQSPASSAAQSPVRPGLTASPSAARAPDSAPAASPPSPGIFTPRTGGFYPPQNAKPATARAQEVEPKQQPSAPSAAAASAPKPAVAQPPLPEPANPSEPKAATASLSSGFIPAMKSAEPASATGASGPVPTVRVAPAEQPPLEKAADPVPGKVNGSPADSASLAAARALDDLAAGFAKNEAPAVDPAVPPVPKAAALDPVEPSTLASAAKADPVTVEAARAPAPKAATPSVAPIEPSATAASSRSLEDVVADMLRPMLQKWIDENMPRIVERALKRDPLLGPKTDA